jgi:O-acetyl-ADP-ribose deacetylase (regulator of RNase III)
MIQYLKGDATYPQGEGTRIIAHICNDRGGWGAGFVTALSRRWLEPEWQYRTWHQEKAGFKLGAVQFVSVEPLLWVANMVAQSGYRGIGNAVPLRYDALAQALQKVAVFAKQHEASVHMPRIGTGLSGGDWAKISAIVEKELIEVPVFVYDLQK